MKEWVRLLHSFFENAPQVCAPSERPPTSVLVVPMAVSDRAGRLGSCVVSKLT